MTPGSKQHRAEEIGEDQCAGGGLGQQHEPEGEIERAEKDLPQEAAPSLWSRRRE